MSGFPKLKRRALHHNIIQLQLELLPTSGVKLYCHPTTALIERYRLKECDQDVYKQFGKSANKNAKRSAFRITLYLHVELSYAISKMKIDTHPTHTQHTQGHTSKLTPKRKSKHTSTHTSHLSSPRFSVHSVFVFCERTGLCHLPHPTFRCAAPLPSVRVVALLSQRAKQCFCTEGQVPAQEV